MKIAVLIGILSILISSCATNKKNVIYPLGKQNILQFLDNENWVLKEVCVEIDCHEIKEEEIYIFGIETEQVIQNLCNNEKGEFYTIGKFLWLVDPVTYLKKKTLNSDPDYFKIADFAIKENQLKIVLCTPYGYYSGNLKIVDTNTIEVISKRPEFEGKEVIQRYKKK